jgi:hypothetical protein
VKARVIAGFAALALAAGGAMAFAPLQSPPPAPKPGALTDRVPPTPVGETAELNLRPTSLNLERATFHADIAFAGALTMASPHERFGGLSALVWEDGVGLSAVSDRGWRIWGLPDSAASAEPSRRRARFTPLLNEYGRPLRALSSDAEGAALDPKGGWLISFEGEHRIWRYPQPGGAALRVRGSPDWADLQSNSGLEAIATAPDGAIFAIPERSGGTDRPFPVWRREGEVWEKLFLPRSGGFLVTDAAVGPDGRLYVLERSLSLLGGFGMRIRRAEIAGAPAGTTLRAETMVVLPAGSGVDNMEGMSFVPLDGPPRGDGRRAARLLVVSDDNFRFFQRTLLLEFMLTY